MPTPSLIKTCLGSYQVVVSEQGHQSHLVFRVEVPQSTKELWVEYTYAPTEEIADERLDQLFSRYQEENNMLHSDRENISSIRNLVTMSLSSHQEYKGSCHRFESSSVIKVNETKSSPGIISKEIEPGFWDVSFNFHALVTEKIEVHCRIYAFHKEAVKVQQPIQIEQVEKQKLTREQIDSKWMKFHKVELHSHTIHSDAVHTTEELLQSAKDKELDWLAITDHNTISAFEDIDGKATVNLIKGVEMTTLFGHFLTLGYQSNQQPMDWTLIDRSNIHAVFQQMKKQGLLIGIAHPFDIGSPYCTGCRWQYVLQSLQYVDFIEVWNSEDPHHTLASEDSIAKWTQLLNSGIEMAATCGRDWHHSNTTKAPAFLHVRANEAATEQDILTSVQLGRSYMTIAPLIDMHVNDGWTIGDRVNKKEVQTLEVQVQLQNANHVHKVRIESNLGDILETGEIDFKSIVSQDQKQQLTWLRVSAFDQEMNRILLTNPIYFE
ncbi:CehA/McbA family metallohydrolase [Pontibacillus litoralis]|nr:CehA/McbA family metallohydrolase [Pontibacillus litoralis]